MLRTGGAEQTRTKGPKGPKYPNMGYPGLCISNGNNMVLGRYLVFGYLDP